MSLLLAPSRTYDTLAFSEFGIFIHTLKAISKSHRSQIWFQPDDIFDCKLKKCTFALGLDHHLHPNLFDSSYDLLQSRNQCDLVLNMNFDPTFVKKCALLDCIPSFSFNIYVFLGMKLTKL